MVTAAPNDLMNQLSHISMSRPADAGGFEKMFRLSGVRRPSPAGVGRSISAPVRNRSGAAGGADFRDGDPGGGRPPLVPEHFSEGIAGSPAAGVDSEKVSDHTRNLMHPWASMPTPVGGRQEVRRSATEPEPSVVETAESSYESSSSEGPPLLPEERRTVVLKPSPFETEGLPASNSGVVKVVA